MGADALIFRFVIPEADYVRVVGFSRGQKLSQRSLELGGGSGRPPRVTLPRWVQVPFGPLDSGPIWPMSVRVTYG